MRFYRTGDAPAGFYRDEAAIAGHAMCLAQSGRTLDGAHWPFLTPVVGGGYSSIVWLAPAAVWSQAFGSSFGAERALAALYGALTVAGVFLFGWFATKHRRVGTYAALATAVSPWAFQFSRIAWDPASAPAYLSWGLAALCFAATPRAQQSTVLRWTATCASALLLALCCISYPPLRVSVPLMLAGFLMWKRRELRAHAREIAAFLAVFAIVSAKLWLLTLEGSIQGRFDSLTVFNAGYWSDRGVTSAVVFHGAGLFVQNLFAHFSPAYLLISGDANPRHSTQSFGEWSWLDAIALAAAAAILAIKRVRPSGWVLFAAFGYLAGLVPAALTWEGVPHALRSIAALPFLGVLVGTAVVAIGDRLPATRSFIPWATTAVAAVFMVALCTSFFGNYAVGAGDAFDVKMVDRLNDPEFIAHVIDADRAGNLRDEPGSYPMLAIRYYELRTGDVRCSSGDQLFLFR